MKEDLKAYNLLMGRDFTSVIGKYEDVVKYYQFLLKDYTTKTSVFGNEDYNEIESIISLLRAIDSDCLKGVLNNNDIIEVENISTPCDYYYTYYKLIREEDKK